MVLQNRSNPILWMRNQRKLTTTDALSIDWFYCSANKDGINPKFIHKATTECKTKDQVNEQREIFNDRICDGFVDCFDQSDEDGRLAECLIEQTMHPHDDRCSYTLYGTHNHVEQCKADQELVNNKPAWKCNVGYDGDKVIKVLSLMLRTGGKNYW